VTGDTMWKRERRILRAAQLVGDTCGEALADKAGGFTCDEAEAVEALLEACDNKVWAEEFRLAHVRGDDDEEDRHHKGWTR
jgi:hypothetical protein